MDRAQGMLTRMGYSSGVRDAELARARGASTIDAFMTGPRLHTLEGIVRVVPVRLEIDRAAGRFYGEFIWRELLEGQWHATTTARTRAGVLDADRLRMRLHVGVHGSARSSTRGRVRVGMATTTAGSSASPSKWPDADEHKHFFSRESIAEQLFDLQTQVAQLRSTIGDKKDAAGGHDR